MRWTPEAASVDLNVTDVASEMNRVPSAAMNRGRPGVCGRDRRRDVDKDIDAVQNLDIVHEIATLKVERMPAFRQADGGDVGLKSPFDCRGRASGRRRRRRR